LRLGIIPFTSAVASTSVGHPYIFPGLADLFDKARFQLAQ